MKIDFKYFIILKLKFELINNPATMDNSVKPPNLQTD